MKLKVFKLLLVLAIPFTYVSCDEIIDPDISKEKVSIYSPGDSVTLTSNTVQFKWNAVEGAAKYRLEIVSPSFNAPVAVIADTILTVTQLTLPLTKGAYQWTVSAINNTATAYADTMQLNVALSGDLSQSMVQNLSPQNALASNNITFTWDKVYSAKTYVFVLWSPSWQSGSIVKTESVTSNEFTYANLAEGSYAWGVKAVNDSTETVYSHYPLVVDVTIPGQPTLSTPTQTSTSVTFQWTRISDSGSTLYDSLFVSTNNQFSSFSIKEKVTATSFTKTLANTGTYYWKVRTYDAAGNKSEESTIGTFIRQ